MNEFDLQESLHIKEQHSEVFTLRSIGSSEEILQLVPLYNQGEPVEQFKSGHWSAKEHIKYIMFIDYFSDIFTIKHSKKLWKIFTIMSAFIKTRNSSQCRSHHQKNERKHKSIQEILELQRKRYKNYAIQFEKMKKVLMKLPIHNPIEVDNQKSTMALLPSIKVLQENLEYQVYKNPISMKNIEISKKDLKQIKNRKSEKNIKITKEKYIGSEVSIQMEDQSQEGYNDRVKSLNVNQIEPSQKNQWNYRSSGMDSSYKKNQKLDKTADTYLDEGIRNLIKSKLQPNLNPVIQSVNSDINSQSFPENVRNYINIVQMKKARSSLPCFDDFCFDEEALRLGQRLRNSKRQSGNTEGKCKTLPPRSVKIENSDDSWLSDNNKGQSKSIRKSLFSGFISSFEESNQAFEQNSKFFDQNHQSFDNFAVENQFESEKEKRMDFRRVQSASERDYIEPKLNLLFCEDQYQNNLRREISMGQSLMSFADEDMLKFEEASQKQEFLQNMQALERNFIKKQSKEPEMIKQQTKQEIQKVEDLQPIRRQSSLEISQSDQQHNTHSQLFFSNSDQMASNMQNLYQNPYFYGYNPTMHFRPIYNHYWFVPQQYLMVEYNMYKFIEFFIYFLIHKLVANNFYLPFE